MIPDNINPGVLFLPEASRGPADPAGPLREPTAIATETLGAPAANVAVAAIRN